MFPLVKVSVIMLVTATVTT